MLFENVGDGGLFIFWDKEKTLLASIKWVISSY